MVNEEVFSPFKLRETMLEFVKSKKSKQMVHTRKLIRYHAKA